MILIYIAFKKNRGILFSTIYVSQECWQGSASTEHKNKWNRRVPHYVDICHCN